jgi:hypothetical protein
MRCFLLLLPLLLAAGPAVAQNLVAARPDSAIAAPAAPDTAAAIHRLFACRRQRRNIIAASLGVSLVAGTVGSLATAENSGTTGGRSIFDLDAAPGSSSGNGSSGNASSQSSASSGATGWLLCAALSWPLIAIDYAVYAGYSRKREKKAVAGYEAGHLSSRLRKRLQAKYFRPAKAD